MTQDVLELINTAPSGWVRQLGLQVLEATGERVTGELEIDERHHQSFGIVHGGVYASTIETLCSIGAQLWGIPSGWSAAGLENHTSFVRAVRGGRLTAVAVPLMRGRRSQLWECVISSQDGHHVATGRVRLLTIQQDEPIAGARPEMVRG